MPARFKLDENLPRDAEAFLRTAGHDVHTVLGEHLEGNPDLTVLDASRTEDRILVTFDLDFSDIRLYPPESHKIIKASGYCARIRRASRTFSPC